MNRTPTFLRMAPLAVALTLASAALHAQTSAPPPGANGPAERVENAGKRAVHATERGVKKAGKATKRTGNRAATAVRHTGERLGSKLPPAPRDQGLTPQGTPRDPKA